MSPMPRPALAGPDTAENASANRLGSLLAAGVALAGAGVLAVSPATSAAAAFEHHEVALTSAWDDLANHTAASFDAIKDSIGNDPFPILSRLGENVEDYGKLLIGLEGVSLGLDHHPTDSGLAGLIHGIQALFTGDGQVPGLDEIIKGLGQDPQAAFNVINLLTLFGSEGLLKPLVPVVTIPERMLENFTSVVTGLFGPDSLWDFGKGAAKAFTEPLIGVGYEFSSILNELGEKNADIASILGNAPAQLLDTLINGYEVPESKAVPNGSHFLGLFGNGYAYDEHHEPVSIVPSTFASLFSVWPKEIAQLLGAGTSDLDSLHLVDFGDLFGGSAGGAEALGGLDLSDLLGGLNLGDLFSF